MTDRVFACPRLMVITDCARWAATFTAARVGQICQQAKPGSVVVQLRDRDLPVQDRQKLGQQLVRLAHVAGQLFVVNDRLDLAVLVQADGVTLTERSVSAADALALLQSKGVREPWIFRAWHDVNQPPAAPVRGCVLSPVVSERKGRAPLGVSVLATARKRLAPGQYLFALGGVDEHTAADCLAAGADGVAVIGAAFAAEPLPLLKALGIAR